MTVNGTPLAEIGPPRSSRRRFLARAELADILTSKQADPGLQADLDRIAGHTTDDLDPL